MLNNFEKIKLLEEKIKELYLHPKNPQVKLKINQRSKGEVLSAFWRVHVKSVIEISKRLAKKYKVDLEVVWLSAILHDIGQLQALEPHEVIGSERAYEILLREGFSQSIAKSVRATILTHRCNKYRPKTLEQKILATADAMSHFTTPHYIWMSFVSAKPLNELLNNLAGKIKRDYENKIFFDNERKKIKKEYEVLQAWCKSDL